MKWTPLYPSHKNFYIGSFCFANDCFKQDLKLHVTEAISYNSQFLDFTLCSEGGDKWTHLV